MNNKLLIGLVIVSVALSAAVGVSQLKQSTAVKGETGVQGERGPAGPQGPEGPVGPSNNAALQGLLNVVKNLVATLEKQPKAEPKYGAVSGPDISSEYLTVNGVSTFYQRQTFSTTSIARTSSTTLCVLPSPRATSTADVRVQVTNSTSTATYLVLEKRQNPYAPPLAAATSGPAVVLGIYLLPANTTGTYVIRSTTTSLTTDGQTEYPSIFGQQEGASSSPYFVAHLKNAGSGTLTAGGAGHGPTLAGSCSAEFKTF